MSTFVDSSLTVAFNIDMDFTNNNGTRLRKIDNNHILYLGEFGSVGYLKAKHTIERVDVFAPSLHMAFGVTYPLEVQVKARSESGSVVTLCYLFDKMTSHVNKFLSDAGFSQNKIKNIDASTSHEIILKNPLSLKDLVEDKSGFFLYEGTSLVGDCEPSMMLVGSEISFMSNSQFDEMIATTQMKATQARPLNMLLYQNFKEDFGVKPKLMNQSITLARFPSSLMNAPEMYQPNPY